MKAGVTIGPERRRSRKCRAEEQSWNAAETPTDVETEMTMKNKSTMMMMIIISNIRQPFVELKHELYLLRQVSAMLWCKNSGPIT